MKSLLIGLYFQERLTTQTIGNLLCGPHGTPYTRTNVKEKKGEKGYLIETKTKRISENLAHQDLQLYLKATNG